MNHQKTTSMLRVHNYPLKCGISSTPKFAEKGLADYAINTGLKCGHSCQYCSSGAMLRMHKGFKHADEDPFGFGYAIIDPDIPKKVAIDAIRIKKRGVVQLCTTVDAWCPAAQKHDLGRKCLEALLAEPGWTARILTKNAAVVNDFDLIKRYKDRVIVGISLTGTADTAKCVAAIEPNASPIEERIAAMRQAHKLGIRTFGMLCPLIPCVANMPKQIDELIGLAEQFGAEEVFAEGINPRGPSLRLTEEALLTAGCDAEAKEVNWIRKRNNWSGYMVRLIQDIQQTMRQHDMIHKLRFLLYPTGLTSSDMATILKDKAGIIWL